MTAEPRIEDLLASIRRAIEDDVGALNQPAGEQTASRAVPPTERAARLSEELVAAANELKQLRERVSRAPTMETPPAGASPVQRAASIVEAIQTAPEQRAAAAARLRANLAEAEPGNRPAPRPEGHHLRPVASPEQTPASPERDQVLLSERSAQAVQMAFGRLTNTAAAGVSERQIEDMTREMLRGMLKSWLDQNLPALVERLVREEIERVARTGR